MLVTSKGMGATLDNQPWYCNGSILSGWLGCDKYLPTSEDQKQMMYQNFGPGMPKGIQDQAVQSFGNWLDAVDYSGTLERLKAEDKQANSLLGISNIPWLWIAIGAGIVLIVRR